MLYRPRRYARLVRSNNGRAGAQAYRSKSKPPMPELPSHQGSPGVTQLFIARLRVLAKAFSQSDLLRLRIADDQSDVEFARANLPSATPPSAATSAQRNGVAPVEVPAERKTYDVVTSDIVGIVHLSRPAVVEGHKLDSDRELAYVEALGIRNAVRSRGAGRVVAVLCNEGDAVDYGRPLFEIDRSQ